MNPSKSQEDAGNVDPEEFLRALLNISPEDAKEVREDAGTKADEDKRDGTG